MHHDSPHVSWLHSSQLNIHMCKWQQHNLVHGRRVQYNFQCRDGGAGGLGDNPSNDRSSRGCMSPLAQNVFDFNIRQQKYTKNLLCFSLHSTKSSATSVILNSHVANYASVRMHRRHTVVVLCVILSFCHSVCL